MRNFIDKAFDFSDRYRLFEYAFVAVAAFGFGYLVCLADVVHALNQFDFSACLGN